MQTIVGVLRGGPSHAHQVSLATGAAMIANLPEESFIIRDIYIDQTGAWHFRGKMIAPERILRQLDIVLLGLHGEYGESGEVQRLLEQFGVPYIGSDSFASYLAGHKLMAKAHMRDAGVQVPGFRFVENADAIDRVVSDAVRSFPQPVIVKPLTWASSTGVSLVGGYAPVRAAVEDLFAQGAPNVLIEEYVRGRQAAIGVIEGLRDEALYTPPVVEILPGDEGFLSQEGKGGAAQYISPARFSRVEHEELARLARLAHRTLGLRDYSESEFILTPHGIYYIETDATPELHPNSSFSQALASVGVTHPELLLHLVTRASER